MKKQAEKTKVYNVIIMDRSGSMWDIQKPAIMGFNEVLGGVKSSQKKYSGTQEQLITLVLFDSDGIEDIYWNADPSTAKRLTTDTYVPGAATPLYDAMGRTLTRLEKELKDDQNHSVVVTVITDGYENSSEEYSCAAINALVKHLKAEGWSFAYMGTDHDVKGVSVSLAITNVIQFEKTEEETMETFRKERRARDRWARDLDEFNDKFTEATLGERVAFCAEQAAHYYDEPNVNPFYEDRMTPVKVKTLAKDEVFVFGSNDKGLHQGGAARTAVMKFGAQMGVAEGPQGQSYAIPTVGDCVGPHEIHDAFERFVQYAKQHPEKKFLVTALGCGHGGYEPEFISNYLEGGIHVPNIHYPLVLWQEFEKRGLI